MLGKLKTVFLIPELRQKIFLTLMLLAVYRMGFAIPLPFIGPGSVWSDDEAADAGAGRRAWGRSSRVVALFSASNIGNSTIFGLGDHAVYLGVDHLSAMLGIGLPSVGAVAKGRGGGPEEDQRMDAIRHGGDLSGSELTFGYGCSPVGLVTGKDGLIIGRVRHLVLLDLVGTDDDDRPAPSS